MGLDQSQKFAVEFPLNRSLFVTAPPGYGKTHVLTERMKYIIGSGIIRPPNKILALTFSNAAANEMRTRIKKQFSKADNYIDIMNFHTFAYRLLKLYGNHIGIERNFTIINEQLENQFKKEFFHDLGWLVERYDDQKYINSYNNWYSKSFLANTSVEPPYPEFIDLKSQIRNELITKNQLNFDSVLHESIKLLLLCPKINDIIFNKYQFILADEFQDTNYIQYLLFKEISTNSDGYKRNVFVVGDKKQAIMKFQGANPTNINCLIDDFNCEEHELQENHRTASDKIKNLTNSLRNSEYETDLSSSLVVYAALKHDENVIEKINYKVVDKIIELKEQGVKYTDICVLFPLEKLSNDLKKSLTNSSINYIQITDYNFRSINYKYSKVFEEICKLIDDQYNKKSVSRIVKDIIQEYYPDEDDLILDTIKNFTLQYDATIYSGFDVWERLQEFYNHIQIDIDWTKLIRSKVKDRVFLSTIHSAKGLEFDYIFMIGMENYQIPHRSKCFECKPFNRRNRVDVSEYKDLFYVGVSRSIKDIFFFFSHQVLNSDGQVKGRKLSCVFEDIIDMLKFVDVCDGNEYNSRFIRRKNVLCKY